MAFIICYSTFSSYFFSPSLSIENETRVLIVFHQNKDYSCKKKQTEQNRREKKCGLAMDSQLCQRANAEQKHRGTCANIP